MPGRLRFRMAIAALLLLPGGALAVLACGARTDMLLTEPRSDEDATAGLDAGVDAVTVVDTGAPEVEVTGVFCSLYSGPADGCDAGEEAGPVQLCTGQFTDCVRVFDPGTGVPYGLWGCCIHKPPENVPDCLARQLIDAACP